MKARAGRGACAISEAVPENVVLIHGMWMTPRSWQRWVDRYIAVGVEAIIPAWTDRMAPGLAARATVDGAPLEGHMEGLDADGALLLRDDSGRVHRVRAGDVEVLRPAC